MTPDIDWVLLAPELVVVATLVVVFVLDLVFDDRHRHLLIPMTVAGLLATAVAVSWLAIEGGVRSTFGGTYVVDPFGLTGKGLFVAGTFLTVLLGVTRQWRGEYLVMLLASLLGMLLVVSARDLVLFFVAFELFAIPGYLLTGWRKTQVHAHEGVLKYYLLGVLATAIMLYGLSMLFGLAGGSSYEAVSQALRDGGSSASLARVSLLFFVIGLLFKISAVPFHFWAPDAYQSAPIPVAAFLSVVTKAAGVFCLAIVCLLAFDSGADVWGPLLAGFSIATMTVGNVVALRQNDLVRLIAYSSIAQGGYLLVPLAVVHYGGDAFEAQRALIEYLVIYAVSNFAALASVVIIARMRSSTSIEAVRGMFAIRPVVAVLFAISLFSLAGMPPFGGWFAKLLVFKAGVDAGSGVAITLVVVAVVNSAIGLVYYANVIRQLWLPAGEVRDEPVKVETTPLVVLVLGVAGVLLTGIAPRVVTLIGDWATLAR